MTEKRDSLIHKLNALRAKAKGASTPEEAMAFANKYEELMAKHRLTETDLEIKSSTVEGFVKTPPKQFSIIERVCARIANLTDTMAVKNGENIAFVGLRVDLEYANWLYDLILNSLENGFTAFPMTPVYHRLLNNNVKPKAMKENYKIGFLTAIANALDIMIEAKKVAGNALVLVKKDIILSFINQNGGMKEKAGKAVKLYDGAEEIAYEGFKEGEKVKLRQGVEEKEVLLLSNQKEG